jgi:hypothetical protein
MHGMLGEGAEPADHGLVLTQRRSPRRAGIG